MGKTGRNKQSRLRPTCAVIKGGTRAIGGLGWAEGQSRGASWRRTHTHTHTRYCSELTSCRLTLTANSSQARLAHRRCTVILSQTQDN